MKNNIYNHIPKKYKKYVTKKNHVGSGTQVSCYRYNKGNVLKICPKYVSFFKYFKNPENEINKMYPFLFKIHKLYDDKHIYIYKQILKLHM